MCVSMYCDICRQPAEIVIYDTTGPSTVPQRVKGVYCRNHSPYRAQPTFGSFCPQCGVQNGHKNGCDYKLVIIGGR